MQYNNTFRFGRPVGRCDIVVEVRVTAGDATSFGDIPLELVAVVVAPKTRTVTNGRLRFTSSGLYRAEGYVTSKGNEFRDIHRYMKYAAGVVANLVPFNS